MLEGYIGCYYLIDPVVKQYSGLPAIVQFITTDCTHPLYCGKGTHNVVWLLFSLHLYTGTTAYGDF